MQDYKKSLDKHTRLIEETWKHCTFSGNYTKVHQVATYNEIKEDVTLLNSVITWLPNETMHCPHNETFRSTNVKACREKTPSYLLPRLKLSDLSIAHAPG